MQRFKEVHLYLSFDFEYWDRGVPITIDFYEANKYFENPKIRDNDILHTTITHFLSFHFGERLFVHTPDKKIHEITLGKCEGTGREIREGHNIEKMLIAGEFDWF